MQNIVRRYSAVLMSALLMLAVSVPAYATEIDYVSRDSFWNWIAGSNGIAQKFVGFLSFSGTCAQSEDSYHHASSYEYDTEDGHYGCVCIYCGKVFIAYASDLSAAYDDYVETLPATGYTSDGSLQYSPVHDYFELSYSSGSAYGGLARYCEHHDGEHGENDRFSFDFNCTSNSISVFPISGSSVFKSVSAYFYFKGTAPIDGYYTRLHMPAMTGYFLDADGLNHPIDKNWVSQTSTFYTAGSNFSLYCYLPSGEFSSKSARFAFIQGIPPVYKITPVSAISSDTYNINTRPTSITGGNYGIVGDNGQITKVEDNSTIINETNNTFYNPATGTTVPIVNWSYDYSDRSYKVTLESGDTATVTYGDENITISQITTTEGDTITNNYTIYYLVDGSGSTTPPCVHDWQETSTTPATCTVPGSKLSTCSKCQQTKKDPIPALGHDWQVKQTVTTEYDDTGQLIQQGYTIFECSRCHEQYKSSDGTIPPGGGSGTDPGGDEGETIWDKLGKLLGTAVKALLDLLGSAVDVILGGLIDLITNLVESLKQLVDLFGTVGEAFQVLWTWLPPEITAILVAGVSIFVFVALLKFFMK